MFHSCCSHFIEDFLCLLFFCLQVSVLRFSLFPAQTKLHGLRALQMRGTTDVLQIFLNCLRIVFALAIFVVIFVVAVTL